MRPFPVAFVLAYGGSFIYFLGCIPHCSWADRPAGFCPAEKNMFIGAVGAFLCSIVKNSIANGCCEREEQFFASFFLDDPNLLFLPVYVRKFQASHITGSHPCKIKNGSNGTVAQAEAALIAGKHAADSLRFLFCKILDIFSPAVQTGKVCEDTSGGIGITASLCFKYRCDVNLCTAAELFVGEITQDSLLCHILQRLEPGGLQG